jgi:G:T/U-mismatch repair DNA glycosylase/ADP-ribose pyrophosphatase YjhB (NUDIX family)
MARRRTPSAVPDVLAPGLDVVFCGINPGRVSAAAAAHFANPRNDFWRLLHAAGFTPRLLEPDEQFDLLALGVGVTNAAYRTTRGSGDLRRGDFAGSAERLARIADELRPRVIAFVGKEAYRGALGERAEHGLQQRRLGEALLFVLPSTSPANAAVPWEERLRWFTSLHALLGVDPGLRPAARALVLDPEDRLLMVRFEFPTSTVWAAPGGGMEEGEDASAAVRRELAEEVGLDVTDVGPVVWRRDHLFREPKRWLGQSEEYFLLRVDAFEPAPRLTWAELNAEFVTDIRWWTPEELETANVTFAPQRLPELLRDLLRDGPPDALLDVGV